MTPQADRVSLRPFESSDTLPTASLFRSVFRASEGKQEGTRIANLVSALIASTSRRDRKGFVACDDGNVIGAIFLTRMRCERPVTAFLLSPVAVATEYQGAAIGQKLIAYGLRELRDSGVELVVTYGDPRFYSKVGFRSVSPEVLEPPYTLSWPEGWLALALVEGALDRVIGRCSCVRAFDDPMYW